MALLPRNTFGYFSQREQETKQSLKTGQGYSTRNAPSSSISLRRQLVAIFKGGIGFHSFYGEMSRNLVQEKLLAIFFL